jgi:nucleoside-diphosphate-sugar epimerase
LSALNRREVAGVPATQADLAGYDAIAPAFRDQEQVVHLGAVIHDGVGSDALHNTNVLGTGNVRRVVFTSSGATVAGWEETEPYRTLMTEDIKALPAGVALITEELATRPAKLLREHQGLGRGDWAALCG